MNKEHLRAIARHLIGKVLGLKVAAKKIDIEEYESSFIIPEYLVFSIKGVGTVKYTLKEQPNGTYRFYINGAFVCRLELADRGIKMAKTLNKISRNNKNNNTRSERRKDERRKAIHNRNDYDTKEEI